MSNFPVCNSSHKYPIPLLFCFVFISKFGITSSCDLSLFGLMLWVVVLSFITGYIGQGDELHSGREAYHVHFLGRFNHVITSPIPRKSGEY